MPFYMKNGSFFLKLYFLIIALQQENEPLALIIQESLGDLNEYFSEPNYRAILENNACFKLVMRHQLSPSFVAWALENEELLKLLEIDKKEFIHDAFFSTNDQLVMLMADRPELPLALLIDTILWFNKVKSDVNEEDPEKKKIAADVIEILMNKAMNRIFSAARRDGIDENELRITEEAWKTLKNTFNGDFETYIQTYLSQRKESTQSLLYFYQTQILPKTQIPLERQIFSLMQEYSLGYRVADEKRTAGQKRKRAEM